MNIICSLSVHCLDIKFKLNLSISNLNSTLNLFGMYILLAIIRYFSISSLSIGYTHSSIIIILRNFRNHYKSLISVSTFFTTFLGSDTQVSRKAPSIVIWKKIIYIYIILKISLFALVICIYNRRVVNDLQCGIHLICNHS